jgi:hypothetical protein
MAQPNWLVWPGPTQEENKKYSGPRSTQPFPWAEPGPFIWIFSNIFLPILHNIGLYIYTVKYKSGIKIPGFSLKYFKKKLKTFSKRKNILLHIVKS